MRGFGTDKGEGGGQKSQKFRRRHMYMPPKPYDSKKSVWAPNDKDGGFIEGLLQDGTLDGGKCTVMVGHEVSFRVQLSLEREKMGEQL